MALVVFACSNLYFLHTLHLQIQLVRGKEPGATGLWLPLWLFCHLFYSMHYVLGESIVLPHIVKCFGLKLGQKFSSAGRGKRFNLGE